MTAGVPAAAAHARSSSAAGTPPAAQLFPILRASIPGSSPGPDGTPERRFNRLVEHYNDKDQIVSQIQLGNARASLAQIRADVERLSREHPPDTPAGQMLVDLRGQCARYKVYLERLARTARVT